MAKFTMLWFSNRYAYRSLQVGIFLLSSCLGMVLIGTGLNFFSYRSVLPPVILPIPSAQSLGERYLRAVVAQDDDYIPRTRACVYGQLQRHIRQYGGAKIRNIAIAADLKSGNSDHRFEITAITFEYQHANQIWKAAEIQLMTSTNLERSRLEALPFRKIYCGGYLFS